MKFRKLLFIFLAIVLVLSMIPVVFAAADTPTITVGKCNIEPGTTTASVPVYVEGFGDIKVASLNLKFSLASELTISGATLSESAANEGFKIDRLGFSNGIVSVESDDEHVLNGVLVEDGLLLTLELTVDAGASGVLNIEVEQDDPYNFLLAGLDVQPIDHVAVVNGSVTVNSTTPDEGGDDTPDAEGYSAQLTTTNTTVTKNDVVTVNIGVTHSQDTPFHAAEIVLIYDATALSLVTSSLSNMKYTDVNGVLTFEDYDRKDETLGTGVYSIQFTAKEVTDAASVKLTSAAFIHKNDASNSNLIPAAISPAEVTIKINEEKVNVSVAEGTVGIEAESEATKNTEFTFQLTDTNLYTYSDIKATINGVEVTPNDNGDGTYTIAAEDVTGDIVISASRAGKIFQVTVTGNGASDVTETIPETAQYGGEGFSFTVPAYVAPKAQQDGKNYTATVTIGTTTKNYTAGDKVTITGEEIVADIAITVKADPVPANGKTISIRGEDVTIEGHDGSSVVVSPGTILNLTLTVEPGYTYSVKINDVEVMNNTTTMYPLTVGESDVVIEVTKSLDKAKVEVEQYLTLDSRDGNKLWLITFETDLSNGKIPTYDDNPMLWSENYSAYCYLISGTSLELDSAKNAISATTGAKKTVDYSGDVNQTKITDAADAQFVANMYNATYPGFDATVTMEKFLSADMDGNKIVNTEDAVEIIKLVLKIED